MHKLLRNTVIALLIFTGISAIGGGVVLLMDTTGEAMQFPNAARMAMQNSIFGSFLIPGLCLVLLIGCTSLIIAAMGMRKAPLFRWGLLYQGGALLIWLVIQLLIISDNSLLQLAYGILGLIFIFTGIVFKRQ